LKNLHLFASSTCDKYIAPQKGSKEVPNARRLQSVVTASAKYEHVIENRSVGGSIPPLSTIESIT
jgi:hypothetical protein